MQWLGSRYNDVIAWLGAHLHVSRSGGGLAGDILLGLSVIIIAAVGARLLMALQISHDRRESSTLVTSTRSARGFAAAAAHAAERGDFSSAVRLTFAAAVTAFDLLGIGDGRESATINEMRHALRTVNAEAEPAFVALARAYSAAAYAEEPVDRGVWQRAHDAYAALSERVKT